MESETPQKTKPKEIPNWVIVIAVIALVVAMFATVSGKKPVEKFVGKPAPFFQLKMRDGSIGGFTSPGRVTVIDFWATWCPPCIKQTPDIERLRNEYTDVDVISINGDDPGPNRASDIARFLTRGPWDFPMLLDDGSVSAMFEITNLPTLVVVRKDGTVHYAKSGRKSFSELESLVEEASE